jgi:hypothetical protein
MAVMRLGCPRRSGDEPDPIKRIKREMAVALHEEDYATAGAAARRAQFAGRRLLARRSISSSASCRALMRPAVAARGVPDAEVMRKVE